MTEMLVELCPALGPLLGGKPMVGRTGRTFEGPLGLSTANNLMAISRLMQELRPGRTLEVGLAMGGSALVFCACHQRAGVDPTRQHVAIDPFQNSDLDGCGLMSVERAG